MDSLGDLALLLWLHQFGNLTILLIVVTGFAIAMMIGPYFGRHILRLKPNTLLDEASFKAFSAIMSMVGVVLAFSLVEANNSLSGAQSIVVHEAAAFQAVDRSLLRSNNAEFAAVRPLLASFGGVLLQHEWPNLKFGLRDQVAEKSFDDVSRAFGKLDPKNYREQDMFDEAVRQLDVLGDDREALIAAADPQESGLPAYFWITISSLLGLCFGLACLSDTNVERTVGLGAEAAAIGLMLAFLIIVDEPFEGQTSVSPNPIKVALQVNQTRN
jgi:hypothetical protein